jgi:hypothetical protein
VRHHHQRPAGLPHQKVLELIAAGKEPGGGQPITPGDAARP